MCLSVACFISLPGISTTSIYRPSAALIVFWWHRLRGKRVLLAYEREVASVNDRDSVNKAHIGLEPQFQQGTDKQAAHDVIKL